MEWIVMLAAGLYILLTGCACGLCYLLGLHRRPTPTESPRPADPAKILTEWLYGGDAQ